MTPLIVILVTLLIVISFFAVVNVADAFAPGRTKIKSLEQPSECDWKTQNITYGKYLLVHFTAKVDVSSEAGEPGQLIENTRAVGMLNDIHFSKEEAFACWIEVLEGKCEGVKAEFVCPPKSAFNDGRTIWFEVEVVEVSDSRKPQNLFDHLDVNKDGVISHHEFTDHFMKRSTDELPLGLFAKEDKNEDSELTWVEFKGEKGTQPPVYAQIRLLVRGAAFRCCHS